MDNEFKLEDIKPGMNTEQRTAAARAIGRALRGEEPESQADKVKRLEQELKAAKGEKE